MDCTSRECPVSAITPQSLELLRIISQAGLAHKGSGASLYGPDLSRWPARMYDALVTVEAAQATRQSAFKEAIEQ